MMMLDCSVLPIVHSFCFFRVADFCDVNKMKSSNLAVVFAPTIMRSPNVEDLLLKDIPLQKKIVEFMIDNYSLLFESQ